MREEALLFGPDDSLAGVLTEPTGNGAGAGDASLPAFVFLNAGVTHRVGPGRLYVRLARELARAGFTSLRFDYSGIGDSTVRTDDLPPEKSVVAETRAAMDLLARMRGIERFVPIGICSGASISYLTAKEDERVAGAVLINGQGHLHGMDAALGAHLRARTLTRHFWRIATTSSFRKKNWVKAVRGQLDPMRIIKTMIGLPVRMLFSKRQQAAPVELPDAAADLRAVGERGVRLFHLYSEGDDGLDYFHVILPEDVRGVVSTPPSSHEVIRGANHVFTLLWSQDRLVEAVCDWAQAFAAPGGDPAPGT